ncbi:MAG: phosphodiester glycosidase family protein [Paludibacteraceae bacterium]|nr:phosphodiester glycosidase family protein [Paludibacteraceae bacterium]
MKRFLLIPTLLMSLATMAQHGTINIQTNLDSTVILQYGIDTLESYQVGPGIIYTRFDITSNKGLLRHCYIYEVDLTNPYNTVEESHHTTMGYTERMADAHVRLNTPGHRSIGSVNCNFWIVSSQDEGQYNGLTGVPCTGQVRNGKIGTNITNWNIGHGNPDPVFGRSQDIGYLMIDDQKRAHIDQFSWDAHLKIGDQTMPINEVNRNRSNPSDNDLVMFNSDMGTKSTLTKAQIDARLGTDLPLIEVVVKLEQDWAINQHMFGQVVSINTNGGTKVEDGYAVFRGRGTGKTFLETAKIGDRVQFIIGMYESHSFERPNIMQLSAGNCYVMREGRLTNRNWNEDYNNKNYPRTGFGVSQDHNTLWLMVMEKPGMYTHEMASILRHFGAWEAAGADGGGSAQFNLGGQIINPTTEGVPRAVGNSIFLFSTAPDDSVVTEMRTVSTFMRLPKYAAIKPDFLGYNQYGMLVSKQLQGVELSCDPETGYITEDGHFVCLGSGLLTASYGNASLPIDIVLVDEANPSLRLSNVLISNKTPYYIEVNGVVDAKQFTILPSSIDWSVEDNTICYVDEDGMLHGLKNGTTTVYGQLGTTKMALGVHVEMVDSNVLLWENMVDLDDRWDIKASSTSWRTEMKTNAEGNACLYINYTGGRVAQLSFNADTLLYSTPKKLEMNMTPQGNLINRIDFGFAANNGSNANYACIDITPDQPLSIKIDLDSLFEVKNDIAIYPIKLKIISFSLDKNAEKKEYNIPFEGIYLHYGNDFETGLESIPNHSKQHNNVYKLLHNGQLIIINNNKIYNILGHEITEKY